MNYSNLSIEQLSHIVKGANQERWLQHFHLLIEYLNKHKTYPVRDVEYRGVAIGQWVKIQREQLGNIGNCLKDGPRKTLRIKMLNKIDFIWNGKKGVTSEKSIVIPVKNRMSSDELWEYRFSLWKECIKKNGSSSVTCTTWYKGYHLGSWFRTQRNLAHKHTLTPKEKERLDKLSRAGFIFDIQLDAVGKRHKQWMDSYTATKSYFAKHGTYEHLTHRDVHRNVRIKRWLARQRDKYTLLDASDIKASAVHIERLSLLKEINAI